MERFRNFSDAHLHLGAVGIFQTREVIGPADGDLDEAWIKFAVREVGSNRLGQRLKPMFLIRIETLVDDLRVFLPSCARAAPKSWSGQPRHDVREKPIILNLDIVILWGFVLF